MLYRRYYHNFTDIPIINFAIFIIFFAFLWQVRYSQLFCPALGTKELKYSQLLSRRCGKLKIICPGRNKKLRRFFQREVSFSALQRSASFQNIQAGERTGVLNGDAAGSLNFIQLKIRDPVIPDQC